MEQSSPAAQLVLLGASNLRMSLPAVLRVASERIGNPLEILVAHGHGRSYGQRSSIPARTLPGILPCQLWNDLVDRPTLPIFALLTDIGNDLLYGAQPAQLLDWIEECVVRLVARNARIVITQLPIESVLGLNDLQYKIFRTFFFGTSRLSLEVVTKRAQETNEGLIKLQERYEFAFPKPQIQWYGVDPIHLRRRSRRNAWQTFLEGWGERRSSPKPFVLHWKHRVALEMAVPCERRLLGREQSRPQPSLCLSDGTTLAFY